MNNAHELHVQYFNLNLYILLENLTEVIAMFQLSPIRIWENGHIMSEVDPKKILFVILS